MQLVLWTSKPRFMLNHGRLQKSVYRLPQKVYIRIF
nr:MAG TPA: hypothetical protein [Caudoviricetes sp.]